MTKRDELIALDPAGLEAAVRECARITAPEISDVEYERIKADNSPRYQNTRAEMERTLRAYLNAARSQPNVQPALEAPAAGSNFDGYDVRFHENVLGQLGATTKSDGDEPSSRTAGGFPVAAAPYHAEETGVIQPTRERAGIERGMDQCVTGGESAAINSGPSDPSSTRSEVTVEAKHLVSSARAFLAHFNPCDLAEDKSQQWQSLEHQCNRVERALLDQFQIRRK